MAKNKQVTNQFETRKSLYSAEYEHDSCGVGFVANINGIPSREIVQDACSILARMEHRGACGSEAATGDGAGILTGIPHKMVERLSKTIGFRIAFPYVGVGNIFLPNDEEERDKCKNLFVQSVNRYGQKLLAWREVPVDPEGAGIGPTAIRSQPAIFQVFIGASDGLTQANFERKLYLIRKASTRAVRKSGM